MDVDAPIWDTVRMQNDPRRVRLGEAVRARRLSLGLRQDDLAARAGIRTRTTIAKIERGEPVRPRTLWLLDKALGWRDGSGERLYLHNETPELAEAEADVYTDPAERRIWGITELTEARRREVIADLREERARLRAAAEDDEGDPAAESAS